MKSQITATKYLSNLNYANLTRKKLNIAIFAHLDDQEPHNCAENTFSLIGSVI